MDSQNGLPNPLFTELQSHPLFQPDLFTVDSPKQQPTALFSVNEQLIEKTIEAANSWKVVTETFPIGTVPTSFGEGVVNSWLTSNNAPNPVTISDSALLNSLFAKLQTPAPRSIAQYPAATIRLSKDLAISQIQAFLNRPDRLEQFKIAFGQDVERSTIDKIIGDWQKQNSKLPDIEILSAQILGKADGGFDTVNNKIYLARNLIERGNLAEIVPVIIEEIGHYLDSKIRPNGDAAGDEGEIFSKLVRGINISDSEYVTLINEDDRATIILNNNPVALEQAVTTTYAIKAEKIVSFNGKSDLDGNPLDLSDDALVYGGKGFSLNGNSILPVKYDASNNPLRDSQGKLVLVDKAVTVAAAYLQANVSGNASNKYAGLNPPQIVAAETVTVPLFTDLQQQELNLKIAIGTPTTTFNITTNPINNLTDWAQKFPAAGTATVPKVVRVTGGGLNIPTNINLSNYVIIVDSGDINFNGKSNLSNVTLVANNGNINLNSVQSDNLSALASGAINHNSSARFGGDTLLTNGSGNITFNGATKGITTTDRLRVVSAGGITFNGAQSTRGSFVSQGDFISNGSATIYGTVSSKQNIIFNGALTFTYANIRDYSDNNPPVILANLVNDSGLSNSDKITNDERISGTISDANQIIEFKAGFDTQPLANFTNILSYLNNGSFSFTKAQLASIYGGTIPDGSHTLNLIATDKYGNRSSIYPYTFTLDTVTQIPTLNLAVASDTGVVGDYRTKSPLVTLTGQTEANARVLLSGNPTPVVADSLGNYTLANVALSAGTNSFTITATDIAGNQNTYSHSIYRTSPPTAVNLATPQVLENSAENTLVGALSTIDPDGVDSYTYSLVDNANGRFKLVGDKIQVANGSLLDFEVNTQHQIQVQTTDSEGDSYLQTIAIAVVNVNESPNNLLVLPTVILENTQLSMSGSIVVGDITTIDPDAGDSFSYTLVAGSGDGDNSKFAIAGDKLVIKQSPDYETQASYTIRIKTTDAGGLSYERQVTIEVADVNEAPISLNITNTTVSENVAASTVVGLLNAIDPDANDTQTFSLVAGGGDTDNSAFAITNNQLRFQVSPDFETKPNYSLRVRTTDAGGLDLEKTLTVNITNINEAPTQLVLDTTSVAENSPIGTLIGKFATTDSDVGDTHTYSLVTGNGSGDNAKFSIVSNELRLNISPDFETQSVYYLRVQTADAGGLIWEQELTVGITDVNESVPITLVEGTSFNKHLDIPITIPTTGGKLSFKLNPLQFDGADLNGINDALEVALIDAQGKSVVTSFQAGRDAFFNWTEGEPVAVGKGASYDSATGIVTLDLTGVKPGAANLVFRLINNDTDTTTRVTVTDITLAPIASTSASVNSVTSTLPTTPKPVALTFFNSATDVSASIGADYHRTSFNATTKELDVNVALKNQGSYGLNGTLVVVVNHISDPSVQVKNADGFTPEGLAYYTFTTTNGKLDPNSVTGEKTLVFRNPNGVQFSYDLTVLSELNAAPVIKSQPELEVIGGKNYQYQIKAEDLNGDSLSYKLLSAPSGMSIDPNTGLVSWNTSSGQIGTEQIAVEVSDGRGGIAQQNYNLAVITPPPNRPPVFTSTPVVDATIGSIYNYRGIAKDLDGDSLTYSLLSAPIGMIVNANTGVLTWTPNGSQLGTFDVTLGVADGQGGTAQQQFKIRTGAAAGNHAPIITSDAVIVASTTQPYTYQVTAVDPDLDPLTYQLGTAPTGMVIDSNTGKITWNNPILGTVQVGVTVRDNLGGVDNQIYSLNVPSSSLTSKIQGNIYQTKITTGGESIPINFTLTTDNRFRYYYGKSDGSQLTYVGGGTEWPRLYNFNSTLSPDDYLYVVSWNFDGPQMFIGEAKFADGTSLVTDRTDWQSIRSPNGYGSFTQNNFPTTEISQQIATANWQTPQSGISRSASTVWGDRYGSLSPLTQFIDHESFNATTPYYYIYKTAAPVGRYYADQKNLGLAGQIVYLDNNYNGIRDAQEIYTTTDTKGNYSFTVAPGTYDVGVDPLSSWIKSSASQSSYQVTLASNATVDNRNFILAQGRTSGQTGNTAPVFQTNPVIKAILGENFRYQAKALDAEGDKFTYDLALKPVGMVVDAVTGLVTWRPQVDLVGSQSVILRVTDDLGAVTLQSFQIQVANANQLPVFTNPVPISHPSLGSSYQYQFSANDPDGGAVTFTLDTPDVNAKIDPNTGVFTWTPTSTRYLFSTIDSDGSFPFVVTATDSQGGRTSFPFALLVSSESTNLPPVIASTPRIQTAIGQTYVYQIAATDPNSDPLTYNLINPPAGMSVNTKGLLTWTPTAAQLGQSAVQIQVSDGRGGVTTQQFGLDVLSAGSIVNHSPEITSTPTFTTNLGKTYSYQPVGTDSDNDTLIWSLDNAPTGMVIDSNTGIVKWNPTSTQIGTHTIAVRLTDAYGLYVGQEYTLKVNGVNTPPQIQSSPNTIGGLNSPYKYQVKAVDAEGDALKYTLGRRPTGMVVNSDTGLITWTPNTTQLGTQIIDVLVTDAQGAVTTQTYNLVVGTTPINQAPTITSTPKFTADINTKYQYQIVATDPENSQITYALTTAPTGMVIDTNTGLITWDNPTLGTTNIQITATDTSGAVAAQGYTLTGKQNQAPVINSTPTTKVIIGNTYRYDVIAKDSDNDALTYSLDNASVTAGVTIDKLGRITWKPTTTNIGVQPVTVTVTDTSGAAVTQTYNLQVLADNTLPTINLVRGTNIANIGETISFQVQATDNVGIKSTQLLIDNQAVTLDSNGVGTYKVTTAGLVTATAIVTDINGNTSTATTTTNIIDPSDIEAPNVKLDLSGIVNGIITGRTDINGTVTDTNLDYYTLEVARFGTNNWQEVFRGTGNVTNGTLGKFDPSLLENDTYRVRLTAYDTSGRGSQIEDELEVTGDLKLGNFRLSFTDLTVPVTGIPISLTRTYDSLTSGTTDDFGYGWRMEFRDTDLRTSLKADPYYEQLDYRTVGFNFGTRIYITLPGGKREGFTFSPQLVQGALGGLTGGRLYYPSFVSDQGVTSTLTVPGAEIKTNTNVYSANAGTSSGNPNGVLMYKEGKLFNLAGRPYVPQDDGFGNRYILTTKDGTQYEINATTGDLESVTDTNGNTLIYSDTEIKSSTGVKVTFERDNQGRIISVTDPLGQKVQYGYDAKGDLVSVKDRDGNLTQFGYNATRSHYLDKIVDPLGREAVKTEYDEAGRLKKSLDVNGNGASISYDPNNSTETILDSYGKPTTFVYDSRGNVVNEIAANGGIITRTYDDDNNQLSETDADGVKTSYTYDDKRNITSIADANGNITRMAYGINNKITSVTSPTGLTTTATYDSRGNLTSSTDTNDLTTTFVYDANGRPLTQTSADGQVLAWGYDSKGNPIKMVDSQGNATNSIFDATGKIQTANSQFTLNGQTYTLDTNFTYNNQGRTLNNTNSKGNSSNNTFNALGQLTSQTDNLGNVTIFKYDTKGQLIEQVLPDNTDNDSTDNPVVKMEYDTGGRKISETSATGLITRYVYDNLGRLIDTIIPDSTPDDLTDNPHLKTEYTLAGRIKAKTDIYGNREEYTYNNLGQEIQMKDVLGNITKYTYDQGGKLATVIDIKNRLTSYRYDNKGRLVETTYFDNSKASLTYDELNRVKTTTNELGQTDTYEHDKFGRVTAVINALSEKTNFEYDLRGNLVKITDANQHSTRHEYDQYARKTATIYADNSRVAFTYDKFDRVTTATDENTHSTAYFYDNLNQLIKVKQANGAETKYTYDNLGRLISTIDPNQNLTAYTYDQFNRATTVILPLGQRNKTVYDKYGQTASSTDYNGDMITYGYDQYGRISQKSFTNPNLSTFNYTYDAITSQLSTVIDGRGTTTYTYDNKDRLASMTNPDRKAVSYGYDLIGNVTSLQTAASTTKYTYDKLNRLDLVKEGTRTLADYDYDAVGNLSQTKLADGSTEVRNYDLRNRLTQITTKNSVGYTFSGFTYTLDAVGNRMQVVENNGRTVDYQYDILNRLTNEQITDSTNGNRNFSYTYDLAGNRLTKSDSLFGATSYSYDANNRLTQTGNGTTITQFTYDNNGSMINRTDGTNTVTYNWANDGENRLLSLTATNPTSTTTSQYVYDAMGSRVASTTDGIRTNYLVAGNIAQVLLEYDANGVITADYTQGLGLIRKQSANREGFYHTDALGSTRLITDNVGLVDRYNYDAFGANLNQTNTFANSFQFAGEQRDGTGLDYLRARYYDASLGRFISKDPYAGSLTDPYSQHSYQYAHANPVRYTDPTGYFTMGEALQTIALAGIIGSTSASIGYVGTKYLLGQITAEDTYDLFGDWVGGFGNGVSGGISTDIYSSYLGAPIKPRDGFLWNMGNVAGISTSFLIGLKVPILYGAKISQASWLATYQVVTTGYGAGQGFAGLTDGKWEFNDVFNLLSLLPLAAPTLGTIKGIAGMKAGNSGGKLGTANAAADEAVQGLTGTQVKVSNCFVAGTEILTIDGIKNIEEIEVGDWVIADDPNTVGEIEYKQVLDTFVRHTDRLVDLYIDGEVISTTGEHPFWTPDKGWIEAKDLVVGSLVQTEDGRVIDVDGVEKREGDFTVYNFKVEGFHTYFVSDLGILVHNADCFGDFLHPDPDSLFIKPSKIANVFGFTQDQVNDAIHLAKEDPMVRANLKGNNPDIGVAPDGEIYIKLGKGKYSGDSIGNILDFLQ